MFVRGNILRFDYPASNHQGVKPRMERRHLLINCCRNPAEHPISERALQEDPLLNRAGELVSGLDLDKAQHRSFWSGAMQNVERIEEYTCPYEVVLCDDESSPEVVAKAPTLPVALTWLQEWMRDPLGFVVGLRRAPKE
jgi:hypothetical protein